MVYNNHDFDDHEMPSGSQITNNSRLRKRRRTKENNYGGLSSSDDAGISEDVDNSDYEVNRPVKKRTRRNNEEKETCFDTNARPTSSMSSSSSSKSMTSTNSLASSSTVRNLRSRTRRDVHENGSSSTSTRRSSRR